MENKKVLIFIPEFPVRTETFIKREVVRLIERGNFDITVFSLKKGKGELPDYVESSIVYDQLKISDVISSLSFLITDFVSVFDTLKTVGLKHLYTFIKGMGFAYKFKKYNPDIIFAHFFSEPSSIGLIASMVLDIEFAISAHARDILEYPDLPKPKVKRAKFIAICNENAYKEVIRLGGIKDPENVKLIYHGLNPKDLEISEEIEKAKPPLILCIGRYVKKKGLSYLIEAAQVMKSQGVDFKLKIAGGGPLHDALQERIDELGVEDRVELLGEIAFENVKRLYYRTTVYTQPSINADSGDADGIPNTLIESSMLKIPIVTTDAGSILDFLDEESASIVPQRDSEALAHALTSLLKNERLRENLVENSYKKAMEMFDIDKSVEKIERLLV